ncbi:MAG: hypothetical protein ABUT20_50910 [Bacteroidota bacterium]
MKNDSTDETVVQASSFAMTEEKSRVNEPVPEPVVIYDECGDTLWDAVLEQEYPVLKYPGIIF